MSKHSERLIVAAVVFAAFLAAPALAGTTYYVDYDNGSDANNGTSPETPFKHCPDDLAETGNAAGVFLSPGDTIIFKGGVHYRSSIPAGKPGLPGAPIVYDGNTAGTFGTGRAIIDGADPVTGWTQCTSAAEVNGNPNYASIYWATIPAPNNGLFHINLCEGNRTLAIAQDPNPSDPFYQDRIDSYRIITNPIPANVGGQAEYVDTSYFTQPDGYWGDDAYFALYARTNRVFRLRVLNYIAAQNKVFFETIPASQYPAGQGRFCMLNAASIIDRPGEYMVKLTPEPNGMHKVYLWPYAGINDITVSRRQYGFEVRSAPHITIQGFIVQKQSNAWKPACIETTSGSPKYLTIRDNIFTLMRTLNETGSRNAAVTLYNVSFGVVENNQFIDNPGSSGLMCTNFNDSTVRNNYLTRCGSTAVDYYGCQRSSLIGNHLYDNRGMHANGLTIYNGNTDILIEGNLVEYGNTCLTAQDGSNITIRNNVFDAYNGGSCIAFWALFNMDNVLVEHNTLVNGSYGIYGQSTGAGSPLTIRNNIIDGLAGDLPGIITHNLYTSLGNHTLGGGDIYQPNQNLIFLNPAARDYHLLPTSAAIDAGANLGIETDFDGRHRPMGAGYDMGAFEAIELSADAGPDQIVPDRGGDGTETVTLDGSASLAPNSTIGAYLWAEGVATLGQGETLQADLLVGDHTITLTVYDDRGWNNSDTVVVSVANVLIADAGADQVLTDDDENGIALVQLDGTGSFDPAGNITDYLWTNEGAMVGLNPVTFTVLPVGVHTMTLTITNGADEQAVDTVQITVESGAVLTPGDADGDGDVDLDDFVALKQNFGRTGDATWADGDFDGDADVDLDDFVLLKQNFGATAGEGS